MIEISEVLEETLEGYSYQVYFRLSSWLNGECLAEDIPAVDVVEEQDATWRVPERLTFRVPVIDDQDFCWVPTSYSAPLGWFGQLVLAQVGIQVGNGAIEWINRGMYLLEGVDTDGSSISVECLGQLQLLDEAEFATEFQPATDATMISTLRKLIEPGMSLDFDEAPADKDIPDTTVTWSENRLDCVYEVLDAWPAHIKVTQEGHLEITETLSDPDLSDVVFAFSDGDGGTVIEYTTSGSREGAFNAVIAEGAYADDRGALAGLPIVHTAYDTDSNSPYSLFGAFSPYLVPFKFQSPLLVEHVETLLAAVEKFQQLRRSATTTVQVSCVPHPALQLYDAVSVTSERLGLAGEVGRIDAITLPYSADGGSMSLTVRLGGLF